MNRKIFREYDIRGTVPNDIHPKFAYNLGAAYGTYLQKNHEVNSRHVTVGYDARLSSPEISEALISGIQSTGLSVFKLGLITSPMSYFSTFRYQEKVCGALIVTGSHNPPNYNGFKISVGPATISGETIQTLADIIESGDYTKPEAPGFVEDFDIVPDYIESFKRDFENLEGVKVIFDCGNGTAGPILRKIVEALRIDAEVLFETPDGRFPNHHPDPTVEDNMVSLANRVRQTGAVCGIGFDGDSDRIGVVDAEGNMVWGDELMYLFAKDILVSHPNSKVVGDVKCSNKFYRAIETLGGQPIMWKTGHSLIKNKIKMEKAPFGGELSGHIFFSDRNYGYDDAIYGACRLIEILKKEKKPLAQLLKALPKTFATPELRIDTTEELKTEIVSQFIEFSKSEGENRSLIDGVRIEYPDGWTLVRSSNTQPVVVFRFEFESEARLREIQGKYERKLKAISPELSF